MSEWEEFDFEDNKNSDDNSGLRQFLFKLLANWYWFVISGIVGLSIAFVYLRYSTPIYQISAKVLVSDEKKGTGLMEGSMLGDLSGMLGAKSTVDNEVEILKTRDLMEQVVRSLDANITYYRKGSIRDVELFEAPFKLEIADANITEPYQYSVKLDKKGDVLEIRGDDFKKKVSFKEVFALPGVGAVKLVKNKNLTFEPEEYLVSITSIDGKVAEFREQLTVEVSNKLVTVIDLGFPHPVKEKGEHILRTLINQYVQSNLNDKNTIADSTIAFIEDRLVLVGEELGNVEGDIQAFKQESQLADISAQSQLLLESSSDYIKELAEIETQLSIIRSMEVYLDGEQKERILPSALLPGDMVFTGLVERFNSLLIERDRQLMSSTVDNPTVINLNIQINNLRKDMESNLQNTKSRLSITRTDLLGKIRDMEGQIRSVPATERTYLDLARQQQIKQELYVFLLQKREETAISKTSNISNSRVIDSPKASTKPISPRRPFSLAIGLVIGLILPFIIIYIKEIANYRIVSKNDITKRTNSPIIGEISHQNNQNIGVIDRYSRSAVAENFRSLRTNLAFFLNKKDQKVVLLTSSMSGEGKSFVALNLAAVIAFSGKRVVVMEMDLRKPKLSQRLNASIANGFSSYIINEEINKDDIITPSGIDENLFLIGSGPIPPNPSELILNSRTDELMTYLKDRFDYIIIDAPPIGLVTDAQLLSKHSDISLYVIRHMYTPKNQLNLVGDLDQGKKLGRMAILFNDIQQQRSYSYGYGYGYYTDDDVK